MIVLITPRSAYIPHPYQNAYFRVLCALKVLVYWVFYQKVLLNGTSQVTLDAA